MKDGAHEHGDGDKHGEEVLWRWRSTWFNKFYGDGDHHENKGHTDSQLCACRS